MCPIFQLGPRARPLSLTRHGVCKSLFMIKRCLVAILGFGLVLDILVGVAISIAALLGFAKAETLIVRPDSCVLPADVDVIAADLDIIARDRNHWREAAEGVLIIYGPQEPGWAGKRLTSRFVIQSDKVLKQHEKQVICVPDP